MHPVDRTPRCKGQPSPASRTVVTATVVADAGRNVGGPYTNGKTMMAERAASRRLSLPSCGGSADNTTFRRLTRRPSAFATYIVTSLSDRWPVMGRATIRDSGLLLFDDRSPISMRRHRAEINGSTTGVHRKGRREYGQWWSSGILSPTFKSRHQMAGSPILSNDLAINRLNPVQQRGLTSRRQPRGSRDLTRRGFSLGSGADRIRLPLPNAEVTRCGSYSAADDLIGL